MIPLYMASASDNALFVVDDPGLDTDEGEQFTARKVSAPFDAGPASGYTHLRRLAQVMAISGPVTVVVTPIADGQEATVQARTFTLSTANGIEQPIEHAVFVNGTRFQVKLEITSHQGPTALGEADQWIRLRRTTRDRG